MSEDFKELEKWLRVPVASAFPQMECGHENEERLKIADAIATLRRERDEARAALEMAKRDNVNYGKTAEQLFATLGKLREAEAALARARAEGRIEGMEEGLKLAKDTGEMAYPWLENRIRSLIARARAALEGEKS